MTLPEIAKLRLVAQQLHTAKIKTAHEMVAYFCAVQGQEYGPSKWGLGLRLPGSSEPEIEKELSEGRILRTHLLRPTWHFVAAEDIRWLLELTGPRVAAINQFMYRKMELAAADFNKSRKILEKILAGGNQMTRDAISAEFSKHQLEATGTRLVCLMMQAELDGIICSGARQGKQFTYALLEECVPKVPGKTRDEALLELARRYFTSRGPATVKDFSAWSGLTVSDGKAAIAMAHGTFESVTVEDETYYLDAALSSEKQRPDQLYLLPIYDEMIMGYKNRDAMLQNMLRQEHKIDVVFDNMIIFDGQVIGSWKRTIKPKHIEVVTKFIAQPTRKQSAAFEKCLKRFGAFHGLPVIHKT